MSLKVMTVIAAENFTSEKHRRYVVGILKDMLTLRPGERAHVQYTRESGGAIIVSVTRKSTAL